MFFSMANDSLAVFSGIQAAMSTGPPRHACHGSGFKGGFCNYVVDSRGGIRQIITGFFLGHQNS